MDTCILKAESVGYSSETITTQVVNLLYPKTNKKLKKFFKECIKYKSIKIKL